MEKFLSTKNPDSSPYTRWIFSLLVISLAFSSCFKNDDLPYVPNLLEEMPDTNSYSTPGVNYLALGDSYTIGEAVTEIERFPEQLVARLTQEGFTIQSLDIIARTGWTTANLYREIIRANLPDTVYNLVSLLIGVNDQFRGRSLDNYRREFTNVLHQALRLAGDRAERVIVLSIPDYGVTPYVSSDTQAKKIAREIDDFNDAAANICLAYDVRFLNITAVSREAANDSSLIASDGLHPSGKMYKKWVDLLLPQVVEMLR